MRRRALLLAAGGLALVVILLGTGATDSSRPSLTSVEDGAVVPANWIHPLLEWSDPGAPPDQAYDVRIEGGGRLLVLPASGTRLVVDDPAFPRLLESGHLGISVARRNDRPSRASALTRVTVDPLAFPDSVRYRMVEPLFNPGQDVVLKTLSLEAPEPFSEANPSGICVGCHSYAGDAWAVNARRGDDRKLVASPSPVAPSAGPTARRIGEFSFLSYSPDGRTLAVAGNTASLIHLNASPLEPFDMIYTRGDILLMDGPRGTPQALPGASDPAFVEDMPSWSPDGKTLAFVRYEADLRPRGQKPMALYTIPVNGGRGGVAVPLLDHPPSAYCYFPRYSPDGRFLSFVAADASKSFFARQSADIWLWVLSERRLVRLAFNGAGSMESWHAWSSDSRWLVFSAKRGGESLTCLYLSRIEASGLARPPVKLSWDPALKANLPVTVPGPARSYDLDLAGAFPRP